MNMTRCVSALMALGLALGACTPLAEVRIRNTEGDEAFLDDVQRRTFAWFWETTADSTGLVPDRHPSRTFSSVAAVGFGLTAYGIGAERGYITRVEAAERTLAALRFFWESPHGETPAGVIGHRGFFYHFLEFETGHRFRETELSTIDTALLMAGVLFAQSYYDQGEPAEASIRAYADSLYRRVEWTWFQRDRAPLITMGWHPETGAFGQAAYQGYNEAMILYLLALGSPTHPVDADVWEAYTGTYTWGDFYGQEHLQFSPMFGHQYSHVWVDFRGIQDAYMRGRGIDYFENSRRATYAQQAYAVANPGGFAGYGETIWGLTASDGPAGEERLVGADTVRFQRYWARGASLEHINDDGTIAPTAAGGSIAFAPEIVIPTLRAIRETYDAHLYNEYGFADAFNPTYTFVGGDIEFGHVDPVLGWFDSDRLGIDQGPIVAMIENHQSGLVWEVMKRNPYLVRGLCRAGFAGGWLEGRCP
ncbi:MAG: glucoamylase family protein [Rhodothermales bacterium]|nr:glucoamylase family protein [Rhodothermales bacterium]